VLVDLAQHKVQAHRFDHAVQALERHEPQLDVRDLVDQD
jgi:hypothetical protein